MPNTIPNGMRERIRASIDMQYYKKQMLVCGIVALLQALLLGVSLGVIDLGAGALGLTVITLIYAPILIYYAVRMHGLMRDCEGYALVEAVLDAPQSGFGRGRIYFTATFKTEDGHTLSRETRAVFSTSIMTSRYFGDFTRCRALVAYHKERDELVVISKIEK